jgi:hypothetical protein
MTALGGDGLHSKGVSYLLWLAWLFGLGGLHRFYLGKPVTGFFYLITWGFFGVGQIIDLFRLPSLVRRQNLRLLQEEAQLMRELSGAPPPAARALPAAREPSPSQPNLRQQLLQEAVKNNGRLSVTQGVLASGRDFAEVEKALDDMLKSGFVGIDNDPVTGHVVYHFPQLARA